MSAFYDQASLVVVPSGYKSGKIYAQKPLTTDGQLTFTRASTATRVNASGLIETVSSGVPRLDYTNSSCPKILLEPQRSNLYPYSSQLDQWTASGSTVTANDAVSPDGTTNADRVQFTAGSVVFMSGTGSAGENTISVYAKAKSGSSADFRFFGNGATSLSANQTATNVWQRFTFTYTYTAVTSGLAAPTSGGGVSDVLFYGFQHEIGSYATSLIPTTTAAVTRLAEGPINLGGAQTLNNFTLFFDGLLLQNGENMLFGSGSSAWYMDVDGSTGRVVLDLASGRKYAGFSALRSGQYFKLAMKRTAGVVEAFVNGVKLTPTTQVTDTTALSLSSIFWGFSSSYYPKMKVNQTLAFQTALTDAQCVELTTL